MKKIASIAAALVILGCSVLPCAAAQETTLRGDADGNGIVNIFDVTAIQRHVADMEPLIPKKMTLAADVNNDGKITIEDATLLQEYLAEYENVHHVEGLIYFDQYELPFIPNF